jgi:prepilin-type N-terminal cleavage/methylation domain-containing protein
MRPDSIRSDAGFSLAELLIAMTIMLLISGAAVSALLKMTSTQATIWNRTQMHSGIRGATEVLQQEVGQAGRIALPSAVQTSSTTSAGAAGATVTLNVSSSLGMFPGMRLLVDSDTAQETLEVVSAPTSTSVQVRSLTYATGGAVQAHQNNRPVMVFGSFPSGVVPPAMANGSTGSILKLYGDINGDGRMVYVEYTCDTTGHNLYRNSMNWNTATKPAATASQILLSNIIPNPNGTPCFTYQIESLNGLDYVTDVAITLTVETQLIDSVTKQKQTETKALLNVSPRNVFNAWQFASLGVVERIQPMPPTITNLLAGTGS